MWPKQSNLNPKSREWRPLTKLDKRLKNLAEPKS